MKRLVFSFFFLVSSLHFFSASVLAQTDASASRVESERIKTSGPFQLYLDCLAALKSRARLADSENFLIPSDNPSGFFLVQPGKARFYGMGWIEARGCYRDSASGARIYSLATVSSHHVLATSVLQKNGRIAQISTEKLTTPFLSRPAKDRSPVCYLVEGPSPAENVTKAVLGQQLRDLIDEKVPLDLDALNSCLALRDEVFLIARKR